MPGQENQRLGTLPREETTENKLSQQTTPYTIEYDVNGKASVKAPFNDEWKSKAKELHGKWNAEKKTWDFGPVQIKKVIPVLQAINWSAPQPKRKYVPRRRFPCGYPGCTGYNFCDECSE